MKVTTFVESGTLMICHDCGETILVDGNTHECPLCGSKDLEVDDSFFEDGKASRTELDEDWFYETDVPPVAESHAAMHNSVEDAVDEDDEPADEEVHYAPIIQMIPTY